jgi:hypothetical protein
MTSPNGRQNGQANEPEANLHSGELAERAMAYFDINARLAKRARQPDFSQEEWHELAQLIAVDEFARVAANKGSRNWQEDLTLRSQWAGRIDFDTEIRRIKEVGNLVYVDLVETITANANVESVNTLAVFEFNASGKLSKLTTYQQVTPEPGNLKVAQPVA